MLNRPIHSKQSVYTIITKYQDKFLAKEKLVKNFPDFFYDFELYNANNMSNGQRILSLHNIRAEGKKINDYYDSPDIRCYSVSDYLVFKQKGQENFEAVSMYEINNLKINKYHYLVPIARKLFVQNWIWGPYVLEFLVKSKDVETIDILQRYKNGNFNENELKINMDSTYSKEDVQKMATDLLKKYNVKAIERK